MTIRYRSSAACPICGGWGAQRRGKGTRCWGYLFDSGDACVCMRVESHRELAEGYLHLLDRPCTCTAIHGQFTPSPTVGERQTTARRGAARQRDRREDVLRTTNYAMRDYATGETVAVHRRIDFCNGDKDFRWYRNGTAGLHGMPEADLPLYRGYEVLHGETSAGPLLLCEGEKPTDAAVHGFGVDAVGITLGAPKVPHLAVLQPLAARFSLIFWPDHDDVGRQLALRLGRLLHVVGIPLRIIGWPDAPPKADAFDFVARGGTQAQLLELIEAAAIWQQTPDLEPSETLARVKPVREWEWVV